jgi:hypothetical protein
VQLLNVRGIGTRNDCQLTINFLIRIYHIRLNFRGKLDIPMSNAAKASVGEKLIKEHAIPVKCIMDLLIDTEIPKKNEDLEIHLDRVMKLLDATTCRAYVTKEEDDKLTAAGFADRMPAGFVYPWATPWIRYEKVGIKIEGLDRYMEAFATAATRAHEFEDAARAKKKRAHG